MSHRLKRVLVNNVIQSISNGECLDLIKCSQLKLVRTSQEKLQCNLLLNDFNKRGVAVSLKKLEEHENRIREAAASRNINLKKINHGNLEFEINVTDYMKDVLNSDPISISFTPIREKVIIEFSSPNIAKEFHVGHLRSTIIGNVISNVFEKLGKDVTKMNYLGDWGTQFGLLKLGVDRLNLTGEALHFDPIPELHKAYVHANKIALGDKEVMDEARNIFNKLESGDKELLKTWQQYKDWTVQDLSKMYERLGVKFHAYEWESEYNKNRSLSFVKKLENCGVIKDDSLGRKVSEINGQEIPLIKSDGSTLYLMRDLMAFFDRRERYNFSKIYYVVEGTQARHFYRLSDLCEKIEPNSSSYIHHIMFGRILGMSTRKNTSVLLRDVLDEAQNRMYNRQLSTSTTKIVPNEEVADILGITALVVHDLSRLKAREYYFDWDTAISVTGKSGAQIQYAHCRLCSLLKNSGATMSQECDPDLLMEPEAVDLVLEIARFEEVLIDVEKYLEPHLLVTYLFQLVKTMNKAFKVLRIKGNENLLSSQRILLFNSCRLIIAEGLRLLGMKVLEEM